MNTSSLPHLKPIGTIATPVEALLEGGESLKLVPETDPILKRPTQKWDFNRPEEEARKLYLDLARTMRENGGIGLSANQVGLPYRVFTLESPYGFPMGLFNPVVVSTAGEEVYLEEGCLSFPDMLVKVKRPTIVRIRFAEWSGEIVTKQFEGITARCILHEIDHLDGLTMLDKANKIHLERALRQRIRHRKLIKQHQV
jgi:peptide deformylase